MFTALRKIFKNFKELVHLYNTEFETCNWLLSSFASFYFLFILFYIYFFSKNFTHDLLFEVFLLRPISIVSFPGVFKHRHRKYFELCVFYGAGKKHRTFFFSSCRSTRMHTRLHARARAYTYAYIYMRTRFRDKRIFRYVRPFWKYSSVTQLTIANA